MKPNDPLYPDQWHLHVLDMERVWDVETGNPEILIAVIEQGFDATHPDVVNNVARALTPFGDVAEPDSTVDHGTHMLGLIAAEMNNGEGGVGVAPGCRLLPIKVGNQFDDEQLAQAIRLAVDEGARVINMSDVAYYYLGKKREHIRPLQSSPPRTPALLEACRYAVDNNVLICSIIGSNQAYVDITWPAAYHAGICVTQGDLDGENPSNFCVISDVADLMAPGGTRVRIDDPEYPWTEHPDPKTGLLSTVQLKNGSYRYWSGGCMATAVASGVAGILYSRFPDLTVEQARQVFRNTAAGGQPWDRRRGYGYIDPLAIAELAAVECDLEIAQATMSRQGDTAEIDVRIENRGVLDAEDVMVLLYNGELDTPRTQQLYHRLVPRVRGRSEEAVAMSVALPAKTEDDFWIIVDPQFQLSQRQRDDGLHCLTQRVGDPD